MGTWTVYQNKLILKIFKNPNQRKQEELSECEPETGWGAAEAAKLCSLALPSSSDLSHLEDCEPT